MFDIKYLKKYTLWNFIPYLFNNKFEIMIFVENGYNQSL